MSKRIKLLAADPEVLSTGRVIIQTNAQDAGSPFVQRATASSE